MNVENEICKESIKEYDRKDMFSLLKNFPEQCINANNIDVPVPFSDKEIEKAIICGMGGSAIGGDVLKAVADKSSKIPIHVTRGYSLPYYADENTLLVCMSYSGNTEEIISVFKEGISRGCIIVCLSSGGSLAELAESNNIPCIRIPDGYPPRCAFGYNFFPCYKLLTKMHFIERIDSVIFEKITLWSQQFSQIDETNPAIKLAKDFYGKVPVLYAEEELLPAMLRWKTQVAENSKAFLFHNSIPEMNHNEIMSWSHPEWFISRTLPVFIRSGNEHPRNKSRMDITMGIIGKKAATKRVEAEGATLQEKLLYLIILGDWVSFYLALINRADPTDIREILYLKNELKNI